MIALCVMRTFPLDAEFHDGETLGSIRALLALDEEYRVSTYS